MIVNFYNDLANRSLQTLYVNHISPQEFIEGETVRSHAHSTANVHPHTVTTMQTQVAYGTVLNWNRSLGKLVITNAQNNFDVNHVVIGDQSHANATIVTTQTSTLKLAEIQIQQDPLTANVSSDFGYSEQLTEFPNTL